MSHPDPLFDPDNAYEDDDMVPGMDDNYDDYNDFYLEDSDEDEDYDAWADERMDYMDGDFDSAMRDAGHGTDEDYGYYGEDY